MQESGTDAVLTYASIAVRHLKEVFGISNLAEKESRVSNTFWKTNFHLEQLDFRLLTASSHVLECMKLIRLRLCVVFRISDRFRKRSRALSTSICFHYSTSRWILRQCFFFFSILASLLLYLVVSRNLSNFVVHVVNGVWKQRKEGNFLLSFGLLS